MKLNAINIFLGLVGLTILYIVLKILSFLIETVFQGVLALFTSGIIYFIIIGIIIYKFRNQIIEFYESIRKKKPHVIYVGPSNDEQIFKTDTQNRETRSSRKTEKSDNQLSNNNQTNGNNPQIDFVSFVTAFSTQEVKDLVDSYYCKLSNKYQNKAGFGENGAKEFIGSLLLMKYDFSTIEEIEKGLEIYFSNSWSPTEFSDYMDIIVNKSKVPYSMWSEVYRYLESNHKWFENHPCAGRATKVSEKSMKETDQLMKVNYTSEGLLDLQDVYKKIISIIAISKELNENYNDIVLESLLGEILRDFRKNYEKCSLIDNEYWHLYLSILSILLFYLAESKFLSSDYNKCVEFVTISVIISTNLDSNKLNNAGELMYKALSLMGEKVLVDPKEMLVKNIPPTLMGKAQFLYSTI